MAIQNFKTKHWAIVGAFIVGVAGVIAGLPDWHNALTPVTVAAFLVQLGTVFAALGADKPKKERKYGLI